LPGEVELLEELVAIPSVSGGERTIAEFVEQRVRAWGLDVVRDETSVRVEVSGFGQGQTLALVSHSIRCRPAPAGPATRSRRRSKAPVLRPRLD